jgi:ketosteroid isomerase-like protein
MRAVLQAYFDGINEERYADVGALFAPDGVLLAPGLPPRRGREEIAGYFAAALAPYPVHRDEPTRTVLADRTATVEITFTGALASGAPMTFDAVDVFDFDGEGRIARLTTWYDSHLVRGRLAAAQALEGPADEERARRGSFAEATPARVRAAMREVRRGRSVAAGTGARWRGLPPTAGPLAARAVLLNPNGAALRPGDVLLVRTGEPLAALPELPAVALAAVALDAAIVGDVPDGLVVGERWVLADAPSVGLLVSVPDNGGAANAAIWS